MCGIAAIWGRTAPDTVWTILDQLDHRGPDGRGLHSHPDTAPATLGHARLAIIDPAGGRQPLVDPASGTAVVCNGMLYNERALRAQLEHRAYRTASDSESVLQGFLEWGTDEAWLPEEIVWRDKLQFDEGSGFSDYLGDHARAELRAGRLSAERRDGRTPEEALYRRIQCEGLPSGSPVPNLTRHWSEGRVAGWERAA